VRAARQRASNGDVERHDRSDSNNDSSAAAAISVAIAGRLQVPLEVVCLG
jgi:hypothetical protein